MKFSIVCLLGILSSTSAIELHRAKRPHREANEKERSDDIYKDDQGERNTAKMSEFDKMSEDDYQRGDGNTNKNNDESAYATDLPHHDKRVGPKKTPKHVGVYDHKKALVMSESPTGIDLVHLTVDTEEHSKRLVKRLFSKGLIAQADL